MQNIMITVKMIRDRVIPFASVIILSGSADLLSMWCILFCLFKQNPNNDEYLFLLYPFIRFLQLS